MAPSPLHPRSTATSTLFAGTLLASFVVVSIPHLFPCPRPRVQYLDSDGRPLSLSGEQLKQLQATELEVEATIFRELQAEAERLEKLEREKRVCPIPKPGGFVGRMLGFEDQSKSNANAKRTDTG